MRIPKSVWVLGVEHKIKVVKGLIAEHGAEGMFVPQSRLIFLDDSLPEFSVYARRTLWHEIAHAYALESGLHESLSPDALEQFCQTVSSLIISLTGGEIKSRR